MSTTTAATIPNGKQRGHYDEDAKAISVYMPIALAQIFQQRANKINYESNGDLVTTRDQEIVKALRFFLESENGNAGTPVRTKP